MYGMRAVKGPPGGYAWTRNLVVNALHGLGAGASDRQNTFAFFARDQEALDEFGS